MATILMLWLILGLTVARANELSPENTIVYGHGVEERSSILPINYFYLQAVDKIGNNITDFDESDLTLELQSDRRLRHRWDKFGLGNGLVLFQYRIYIEAKSVALTIKYLGQPVAKSPYYIGTVFHEDCSCPLASASQWLKEFKCCENVPQIADDLKPFKDGVNITGLYERAAKQFSRTSFVHYSIVNRKLYARTFGDIVGFKFLSDMILLSIVNKVVLPDMELVVNLGDWPLSKKKKGSEPFPMFSWCGSHETWDIVWPTWDFMKSTIMGMDRVTLSILTAQKSLGTYEWDQRDPRVFFRGRDSNQARLDVMKAHHRNTELFDVGITDWFFFKKDESLYGPVAQRIGFYEFFKYKYQLNIDGTVAAYRLPYLLAGGSAVLKQDSTYYEHFYRQLVPWVHYIPLKKDVSDLLEWAEWARENDKEVKKIADNSVRFVQQHLLPDHIYCYIVRLLLEYSRLIVGSPRIHEGMTPVTPETPHDCEGFCDQVKAQSVEVNDDHYPTAHKDEL